MELKFIPVLGLPFIKITRKSFVSLIQEHIDKKKKTFIVTGNPEIVMHSFKDEEYRKILKRADFITADGIGIVKAAKLSGTALPERVSGFDIMKDLFAVSQKEGYRLFFLGAEEHVLRMTVARVENEYPGISIAGSHNGYFDWQDAGVIETIKAADADIVLVALGCPLQEKWIGRHIGFFDHGVFMGVGGSFDVLSGNIKRAPIAWRKLNLEWFYRLLQQPSRWKRLTYLPKFVGIILLDRWRRRR